MSPTEAAMRKLIYVEGQAVHHIWKVFKYGIYTGTRLPEYTESPNRVLQTGHLDEIVL